MRQNKQENREKLGILEVRLNGFPERIFEPMYLPPQLEHSDWEYSRNNNYMGTEGEGN